MNRSITQIFMYSFFLVPLVFAVSCKNKAGCTDPGASNYDPEATKYDGSCIYSDFSRPKMLENLGENVILPRYKDLSTKTNELDQAVAAFANAPDQNTLNDVRAKHLDAWNSWQRAAAFEFGPAEEVALRLNVNTFPVDTAQIENNISSGDYDLSSFTETAAKGFAALDYLLYGTSSADSAIINAFTSDTDAPLRKTYLKDIAAQIKGNTETVYTKWTSGGGNYINTFKTADGTDVGSSLGQLVNQLNFELELIKNPRIGIPLGKKTLGEKHPEKTEAYYSGNSAQLAIENFRALNDLYYGNNEAGNEGLGLDDYLDFLEAQHTDGPLTEAIAAQLVAAQSALNAVNDPLSETIIQDPSTVDKAYNEIQKQVVLFKTDMASAMGILITYQDNDGD